MTDGTGEPKDEKDVEQGFDLPEGEATPPPEEEGTAEAQQGFDLPEDTAVPPPFVSAVGQPAGIEPHVRKEEERKKESVVGKLIALIAIPIVAVVAILLIRQTAQRPLAEYEAECKAVAQGFLKGMSESTEDSLPAAYNMLHRDLRARMDTETVEDGYKEATKTLEKFQSLEGVRWDKSEGEASRSFRATAKFDKGTLPVWFRFARVTDEATGKTDVKISDYKLGVK